MCLGITLKKQQCKKPGTYEGYCHLHRKVIQTDARLGKVEEKTSTKIPRFLGINSFLDDFPVVNVVGSSKDKPPKQIASSWIMYYMYVVKKELEIPEDQIVKGCAVEGCTKHLIGGTVGAHVLDIRTNIMYIVPFCRRHNSLSILGARKLDEEEKINKSISILDGKVQFKLRFDTRLVRIEVY